MSQNEVKRAILLAGTKRLKVSKNIGKDGWTITLPAGAKYRASTDYQLASFVNNFTRF